MKSCNEDLIAELMHAFGASPTCAPDFIAALEAKGLVIVNESIVRAVRVARDQLFKISEYPASDAFVQQCDAALATLDNDQ